LSDLENFETPALRAGVFVFARIARMRWGFSMIALLAPFWRIISSGRL
jgi:hypothetical protein